VLIDSVTAVALLAAGSVSDELMLAVVTVASVVLDVVETCEVVAVAFEREPVICGRDDVVPEPHAVMTAATSTALATAVVCEKRFRTIAYFQKTK